MISFKELMKICASEDRSLANVQLFISSILPPSPPLIPRDMSVPFQTLNRVPCRHGIARTQPAGLEGSEH